MIRVAKENELIVLKDMFWNHILSHPEYISHGEIQMGVCNAVISNEGVYGQPAENGQEMWMKYIMGKFRSENARIIVVGEDCICGFCVAEITDDGAAPFGILCDILVDESFRGKGYGRELFDAAIEWFHGRGITDIYLESGNRNEAAHIFFSRLGFRNVSKIFKLK